MDLALLDTTKRAEEGVRMTLKHPVTNEDLDVVLIVRGPDAKVVKLAFSRFRQIMDDERKSATEKDKEAANLLAKCIIGIENAEYAGKPLESDTDGIKFFIEHFQWAASQVFAFLNELENFLPESDKL